MSKVANPVHHNKSHIVYSKAVVNAGGKKHLMPVTNAEVVGPGCHDEILNIPAISANPSFGNMVEYAINPESDVLKDLAAYINTSALTVTGGTYKRFLNDATFLLQRVEFVQGSETIQTLYPESLSVYNVAHLSTEQRNRINKWLNIAAPESRNATSSTTQTFIIPLYSFIENCHIPLFMCGQIRVRIWLQPLSAIVQTDGSSPVCTITSTYLRAFARVLDQAEKDNMVQQMRKNGSMSWRILDCRQQIQTPFTSGGTSYDVNLNGFSGHVSHLFFMVRNASDVNTALSNNPDSFQSWNTFFIKNSAGEIITKFEVDSSFNRGVYSANYLKGDLSSSNIGFWSFNANPEKSLVLGSQEGSYFFGANGEQLNIKFASATSAAFVVDVLAYTYNTIELLPNGQLRKID